MRLSNRSDAGYTIVEVLVAIVVFSVVMSGFYQVLNTQAQVAGHTRSISRIADEARLGFNRMVRDIREADAITWVSLDRNAFTINVNFDGNANYESPNLQGDDEVLTYTFNPTAQTITLCNASDHVACNASNTEVLMSGTTVVAGKPVFEFSSNNLEYDWGNDTNDGPQYADGVTSWRELDRAETAYNVIDVGNNSGTLDIGEWGYVTTVAISVKQTDSGRSTNFLTRVQMRNRA